MKKLMMMVVALLMAISMAAAPAGATTYTNIGGEKLVFTDYTFAYYTLRSPTRYSWNLGEVTIRIPDHHATGMAGTTLKLKISVYAYNGTSVPTKIAQFGYYPSSMTSRTFSFNVNNAPRAAGGPVRMYAVYDANYAGTVYTQWRD